MSSESSWTPRCSQLREILGVLCPTAADVYALIVDLSDVVWHLDRRIPESVSHDDLVSRLLAVAGTKTVWTFLNERQEDRLNQEPIRSLINRLRTSNPGQSLLLAEKLSGLSVTPVPGQLIRAGSVLLGRYVLREVLSTGSVTRVWRAEAQVVGGTSSLGRPFVVKMLRRTGAQNDVVRGRFVDGALQVKALANERLGIVPIVDGPCQEADGQVVYFVVPYYRNRDLQNAVLKGAISTEVALHAVLEIGNALDDLHRAGIVHRNVHPQNILLDDNWTGLLDNFDKARFGDEPDRECLHHVGPMDIFLAPEWRGPEPFISHRADIYGLAATTLFVLIGRELPPAGHVSFPMLLEELAAKKYPARLITVLSRALQVRPADRHDSADALCRELRQALFTPKRTSPAKRTSASKRSRSQSSSLTDTVLAALGWRT